MHSSSTEPFMKTYFSVRQALGFISIIFPLFLVAGGLITDGQILPSISDYYFSSMRDFVVGALVAIGIFLMAYRGELPATATWKDNALGVAAGSAAIGLALFPNKPHGVGIETFVHVIMDDQISVILHFMSSFVFLTSLTLYCLRKFCREDSPELHPIYRACGFAIVTAGVVATLASIARAFDWFGWRIVIENWNLIFWLEAAGIWAFCIAWLVKGKSERSQAERALQNAWMLQNKHRVIPAE